MLSSRNWKCVLICCYQPAGEKLERIKAMPRTYIRAHTPISRHTHFAAVYPLPWKKRIPEHAGNAMCEIKEETERNISRERKTEADAS